MDFIVIKTNIINVAADAIVLPANENLKEGRGTSRAIFEAAGRKELTKACSKIGTCNIGCSVPTLAYKLKAKYIVHSVVPQWVDGNHYEYDLLSAAYLSALNIADIMGCNSIAFPVLASGNNGFDKELAVHIAKETIGQFSGVNLKKVVLVVYGDDMEDLMKSLGYSVMIIPKGIGDEERKAEHKAKAERLLAEGKEIAQKTLEDHIEKAIVWLKDEKHRDEVIKYGIRIAKIVLTKYNPIKK